MNNRHNPGSRLTALLDALERELLAAHSDDVRDALRGTGRARNAACQEVQALLNEAIVASGNGCTVTPPRDIRAKTGLHRH